MLAVHCCATLWILFRALLLPGMSFCHPFPQSLLHFPIFFPFLTISSYSSSREKALAKTVSTLGCMVLTFTFLITSSDSRPPPPFFILFIYLFYLLALFSLRAATLVSLSFTPASHWPINHLCWREHPAVLCNFLSPRTLPCL